MRKIYILSAVIFIALCIRQPLSVDSQESGKIAPSTPFIIADFEAASDAASWQGLPCQLTTRYAASGSQSMSFTIPKWHEGDEERPGVILNFNEGTGFAFNDWPAYRTLVAEVWIDGDAPASPGMQIRDSRGRKSWTAYDTFAPGVHSRLELSLDDAGADMNIHDVNQIVFYDLRPDETYTVTIDCIRLIPKLKPPIASFRLLQPNYRNLIAPDQQAIAIEASDNTVNYETPASRSQWRVLLNEDDVLHQKVTRRDTRLSIDTTDIHTRKIHIRAELFDRDNKSVLAKQEWEVTKASPSEYDDLTVHIDENNNAIVNGNAFFPLGWYSNTSEKYLDEIADSPFNCILAYGTDFVKRTELLHYLDRLQEKNLKLIYCMNDIYPGATYFDGKDWEGVTGNENIASAVVDAYKNHPAILAWYLNDELPRSMAPQLEQYYQRVKNADPNHPCYIVLCQRKDLPHLQHTTDILGVDPYPIPHDPIVFVNEMIDKARDAVHESKPIWAVLQAFGWYQYNSKNPDRGHVPTEEELLKGRAPTYEETRCMTYLALTHGAKGIIYYCYYDFRLLPEYETMWKWMKSIASEVKTLSPALLSNENTAAIAVHPDTEEIHTLLKEKDGKIYLLAVNSSRESVDATLHFDGIKTAMAERMFEDHAPVPIQTRTMKTSFAPLEAHVYELSGIQK
ncbi:MAG: hypothetical protein GC154_17665 [bacterium]|nr:hypothetical protein [bacterium]